MKNKKQNKFLSSSIYEQVVPKDSFWRKVKEMINWAKWADKLSVIYQNTHGGNSNYPPDMLLKMLLIQRVYNSSDRKTEELCSQNIMVKYFLGLEIQQTSPDYSTLAKFRNQILEHFGPTFYEEFFQDLLITLQDHGLTFSGTYAVDSTISNADVNTWKDKVRQEEGKETRDKDASWTAKSRPKKGSQNNAKTFYHGYKTHAIVDIKRHLITAIIPTTARRHDSKLAYPLVQKGRKVDKINTFIADAAYDDAFLINQLEEEGTLTAIRTRKTRTEQIDQELSMHWKAYNNDKERKELLRQRGIVERPFADLKVNHGLEQCRYVGLDKYAMQAYMSVAAMNLKIGIKQLFNISLHLH